jgi:hypothetical protein
MNLFEIESCSCVNGRRLNSRVSLHAAPEPAGFQYSFVQKLAAFQRSPPECLNLCMTNLVRPDPDRYATYGFTNTVPRSRIFLLTEQSSNLSADGTHYPLKTEINPYPVNVENRVSY